MTIKASVTLRDVAKAVGVKDITVSRAFSGKAPVAVQTRKRIMEVAAELGYRPSQAARAIRTGRTGMIGMIRSPIQALSVHAKDFLAGVDESLHERGMCLMCDLIDEPVHRGDPDADAPRIVREHAVDGLLINYAFGTLPAVRQILDLCRLPAIWINRKRDCDCVHPDDEGAAYEATRFLIAQGHRDVVFLDNESHGGIPPFGEEPYSKLDRRKGYERAMREASLPLRYVGLERPACEADHLGYLVTSRAEWLLRPSRPTAVLCAESGRALVIAALHAGLSVPRDISIMTFANDETHDNETPIDSVLVPNRRMGHAAVDEICALIDEPNVPRRPVVIPFAFHQVGTVARPNCSTDSD